MNTLLPPSLPQDADVNVHTRRCVRHPAREAAAKCQLCTRFFCRECVVEHQGRLLCSDCLRTEAAAAPARPSFWARSRPTWALIAAMIVTVFAFYLVGSLLLKIPPRVHDGTIWRSSNSDSSEP